jgi:uncharacterized membrane protein
MFQGFDGQEAVVSSGYGRLRLAMLWLALSVGWAVSIFTVIEELCLATACSDTASFTFFGVGMGWFGIAYFSAILVTLWLRRKIQLLEWALTALVSVGAGAELRLLWIQKYIIGAWCPLCVTICCALFVAATLLLIERICAVRSTAGEKGWAGWLTFSATMSAIGLVVAYFGVKALT